MKILLYSLAFSNPDLLDKCLLSWPKGVDKAILWQGNKTELQPIYEKHKNNCAFTIKRINNWGYGGGNNLIFKEAFDKRNYDAVIGVGSDTEMLPGFWENFIIDLDKYDFVESTHQFNCFYISKKCFKTVGSFDENFFPAYIEDDDYRIRILKSGIKYKNSHGSHDLFSHVGSATIKSLSEIEKLRAYKSFQLNRDYMERKWGGNQFSIPKWRPVFEHPFDDPDWPLYKWVLNSEERKNKLWDNLYSDPKDYRLPILVESLFNNPNVVYDWKT
jgi:hypothetical protein